MARRKSNNTELGCMLGLLGGLLAVLFTGSKEEKKVGWIIVGVLAGIFLLISAGVSGEALAGLIIFAVVAFLVAGLIFAIVSIISSIGKKNSSQTTTQPKATPNPPKANTATPKITMPKKDAVSNTANFDAQFAEMEKQVNSVIGVPNQTKEPIKPVQNVNLDAIPTPPIPSSSPVRSAKVEIKAYEPEEEEKIDNVLMSMWYEDEIKEIYKKLKQLKSGEITESDYQAARTRWLTTYRDREPNDNRYNQQVEALTELEMED